MIKGWAKAGLDPPKELSKDDVSIPYAGLTWYPKPDLYKLIIQSLHFLKKKRGIPLKDSVNNVKDYIPDQITKTNCTFVVAHI